MGVGLHRNASCMANMVRINPKLGFYSTIVHSVNNLETKLDCRVSKQEIEDTLATTAASDVCVGDTATSAGRAGDTIICISVSYTHLTLPTKRIV